MTKNVHKPNLLPAHYFVCFFDALGTREDLFSGIDLKNPNVSVDKLSDISRHALATHEFLSGIATEISAVQKEPIEYMKRICSSIALPKEVQAKFEDDVTSISCGCQQFSDTTMFYVRDSRDDGKVGLFPEILFENLILSASLSLIRVMAKGCFYRGAMVYGTGWELDEDCLFGPVVQEAYRIEENDARWPRIVIAEEMKDRLQQMSRGVVSKACPAKMICADPDGKFSLDFWSVGAVDNYLRLVSSTELLKLAEEGYNQAVNQQKRFAEKMRADDMSGRLFLRYGALLSYLDDRMIARGLFKPIRGGAEK